MVEEENIWLLILIFALGAYSLFRYLDRVILDNPIMAKVGFAGVGSSL